MAKRKPKILKDGSLSEGAIQALILDWLKDVGLLHWRQNSGNVFAGNRRIKLGESGLPDIIVIAPPFGGVLGLEVKSARGKVRPDQIAFAKELTKNGGRYHIVRSLADAMDAVAGVLEAKRFGDSNGQG